MISQSAEYSLRAILCLAAHRAEPRATALTTQQIADHAHIPAGYLAKVLQVLGRAGLVTSQRGLNGGFVLNADPARLSLLDIVSAVEPSRRISACPLGLPEHRDNLCPLHRRLDDAAAGVEKMLAATTIADVLAESSACNGGAGASGLCPHSKEHCHAGHAASRDRRDAEQCGDRPVVDGGLGRPPVHDPAAVLLGRRGDLPADPLVGS